MQSIATRRPIGSRNLFAIGYRLVGVLAALIATQAESMAQPATWTNYTGTITAPASWNDVTNWTTPPDFTSGDGQLLFQSSLSQPAATFSMTNDVVGTTINRMTFALDGYTFVPAINSQAAATLFVGNDPNTQALTMQTSSTNAPPSIVQNGNGSVLMQATGGLYGTLFISGTNALQIGGTGIGVIRIDAGIASSGTSGLNINHDPSAVKAFSSGASTILSGSNTFTGNVILNNGSLGLGTSSALGDPGNQLIINAGSNSVRFVAPSTATVTSTTGPITIANNVILNSTMLISSADAGGANFTGTISGTGGITLNNQLTVSSGFFNFSNAQVPNFSIQAPATFSGPLIVKPISGGAGVGGSNLVAISSNATTATDGSLATTNIQLYPSGYLALNDQTANHTRLAPNTTITSYRGFVGLFANASANAAETIGTLNASGWTSLYATPTLGGVSSSNPGGGAQLTVTTLNRPQNGTLEFRGTNVGGTPGANVTNFYITNNPGGATPGSATPGTQNLSVLPYAFANAFVYGNPITLMSSTTNPSVSLVRYDAGSQQVVPLNTITEYSNALTLSGGATSGLNYYINGGGNAGVVVNNSSTVNGLVLINDVNNANNPTKFASIGGTGVLNVTGPIVLGNVGTSTPTAGSGSYMGSQIGIGGLAFGGNTAYVHTPWSTLGSFNFIATPMSGTGGFVKSGQSDVTLYGTNSISGGMTINGGNVVFDSDSQLGAAGGSITMNSGNVDGLIYQPNTRFGTSNPTGITISRPLILGPGGGTLSAAVGSAALTWTGPISGSGTLFKGGTAGILYLNPSSNTATGDVGATAGTLIPANDAALGAASNRVILSGGVFQPGAGYTSTSRDFLNGSFAGGTIYTASGDFTINGTIAQQLFSSQTPGASLPGITKIGTGNLILTNSSTVTGSVTIGEPTTTSSSARYSTPTAIQAGGALTLSGPKGAMALAGGFFLNDGASLVLDNSGVVGNINNDRVGSVQVTPNGSSSMTLIGNANGNVSEVVGNIATGGGNVGGAVTITLNQPSSGGAGRTTTLSSPFLGVYQSALPEALVAPTMTLLVRGTNLGASSGDYGQFLVGQTASSNTNGSFSTLTTSGLGFGIVTASSPTSAPTDFAKLGVAVGSQSSIVPLAPADYGTFASQGTYSAVDLPGANQLTAPTTVSAIRISGGQLDLNGQTLTMGSTSALLSAGAPAQAGMILSSAGANTGIIDSAGSGAGTIEFGTNPARFITPTNLSIGTASNPVALQQTFTGVTTTITDTSSATLVKTGSGTLTLYGVATQNSINAGNGVVGNAGTTVGTFVRLGNAGLDQSRVASVVTVGEGKLVLGNAYALGQTFSSSTTAVNGALPNINVNAGATLDINNQALLITAINGAGTVALGTGQINLGANSNFSGSYTGTAASNLVIGYPQQIGVGVVNNSYGSSQNINLFGDNSGFLGTYQVLEGNLQFRSAHAIAPAGNNIILGDTYSPNSSASATRSATVVFYDLGTSYNANITVPAMTLQAPATNFGASLIVGNESTGGFMSLNGTITLNRAASIGGSNGGSRSGMFTVNSLITGTGQLIVNPNTTFAFSGGNIAFTNAANNYAGGTLLNEGAGTGSTSTSNNCIVAIGADTVFSNGTITLDNQPGLLRADNGARNLANTINVNPSTTGSTRPVLLGFVGTNDFTLSGSMSSTLANPASAQLVNLVVDQYSLGNATFGGNITNGTAANITIGITKNGPGTLNLTGAANTFSGANVMNAGTLGIGANSALGTGALTINGGTFKSTGGNFTMGNTMSGPGSFIVDSPGTTLTMSGASTVAGTVQINNGTLTIGNATTLGNPTNVAVPGFNVAANTNVLNGASLDLNGQQTVQEPIVLNGSGVGGNGALINSNTTTAARIGNAISSLTIKVPTGDITASATNPINITGGGGAGATAVASLGLTQAGLQLDTGGSYPTSTSGPTVSITGGGGSGATASVVYNATTHTVTGIILTAPGSGYTGVPTITISTSGTGSTVATGHYNNGTFQLVGATLTATGNGYTGTPSATLSSGTSQLTANASSVTLASTSSIGGPGDIIIDGQVLGSGGLTKIGNGTLTLNAANTYSGGTNVSAGTVVAASDASIGTGNVTGTSIGTLTFTGTTTTSKSFAMGGGTIATAAGQTVNFNGGQVSNAYLDGPGGYATTAVGTQFINVTTTPATAITSNSAADVFRNFTNSAALTVAPGINTAGTSTNVNFNSFVNQGLGSVTVGASSQVNVSNFQTYGTLTLSPGTTTNPTQLTNLGSAPLGFNAGSRTFLSIPSHAGAFDAGIDLHGQNAIVAGGLFVNNGYVIDSVGSGQKTIIADYGALVKGAGFYQNSVQTVNGGKFQSGNSPGASSFGTFVFGGGGDQGSKPATSNYLWQIDDAGPSASFPSAPGVAGGTSNVSGQSDYGWSLIQSVKNPVLHTPGDFYWDATPSDKLTIQLQTLSPSTTVGNDVQGAMGSFDPNIPYTWKLLTFQGSYLTQNTSAYPSGAPTDSATLTNSTTIDLTTGPFSNALNPMGHFNLALTVNSPAGSGGELDLVYTVPEPGTLALTGLAGLGIGWVARRRKRSGVKT